MKEQKVYSQTQREREWQEVEDLTMLYQEQFLDKCLRSADTYQSQEAAEELLRRFSPLFKKYMTLLRTGNIDYSDLETRLFVCSFMDDLHLQRVLRRAYQTYEDKLEITKKFKFIIETYGAINEDEMLMDLQMLFLTIAKRYKQMGRTFCGYLYNTYRHEVSRHIKKHIKNPINIPYKILEFEECINGKNDAYMDEAYEDNYYQSETGLPDLSWMAGVDCSEEFACLNAMERKILVKYYLEEWNDRQISELFGLHINTVNQKRRNAIYKVADAMGIDRDDIKRSRRSGKNASLPMGFS